MDSEATGTGIVQHSFELADLFAGQLNVGRSIGSFEPSDRGMQSCQRDLVDGADVTVSGSRLPVCWRQFAACAAAIQSRAVGDVKSTDTPRTLQTLMTAKRDDVGPECDEVEVEPTDHLSRIQQDLCIVSMGEFDHGFAVEWMRKDLAICLAEANRLGARLPVTALVDQFYQHLVERGGSRWDTSSLVQLLQQP